MLIYFIVKMVRYYFNDYRIVYLKILPLGDTNKKIDESTELYKPIPG